MRAGAELCGGGVRSKFNTFDVYHEVNTDRIVDPGDLKGFDVDGYAYDADGSEPERLRFIRA